MFYQREDTQKRHDKSAGDYGLLGGRANQQDIPSADKAALLKELQAPDSALIKNALPETLKRELQEEAGLLFETHYSCLDKFCPLLMLQSIYSTVMHPPDGQNLSG